MGLIFGFISGVVITALCVITGAFVLSALLQAFKIEKSVSSVVGAIIFLVIFVVILMNTWHGVTEHVELVSGFMYGALATFAFAFKKLIQTVPLPSPHEA